eukprot:Rmarinus@m.14550
MNSRPRFFFKLLVHSVEGLRPGDAVCLVWTIDKTVISSLTSRVTPESDTAWFGPDGQGESLRHIAALGVSNTGRLLSRDSTISVKQRGRTLASRRLPLTTIAKNAPYFKHGCRLFLPLNITLPESNHRGNCRDGVVDGEGLVAVISVCAAALSSWKDVVGLDEFYWGLLARAGSPPSAGRQQSNRKYPQREDFSAVHLANDFPSVATKGSTSEQHITVSEKAEMGVATGICGNEDNILTKTTSQSEGPGACVGMPVMQERYTHVLSEVSSLQQQVKQLGRKLQAFAKCKEGGPSVATMEPTTVTATRARIGRQDNSTEQLLSTQGASSEPSDSHVCISESSVSKGSCIARSSVRSPGTRKRERKHTDMLTDAPKRISGKYRVEVNSDRRDRWGRTFSSTENKSGGHVIPKEAKSAQQQKMNEKNSPPIAKKAPLRRKEKRLSKQERHHAKSWDRMPVKMGNLGMTSSRGTDNGKDCRMVSIDSSSGFEGIRRGIFAIDQCRKKLKDIRTQYEIAQESSQSFCSTSPAEHGPVDSKHVVVNKSCSVTDSCQASARDFIDSPQGPVPIEGEHLDVQAASMARVLHAVRGLLDEADPDVRSARDYLQSFHSTSPSLSPDSVSSNTVRTYEHNRTAPKSPITVFKPDAVSRDHSFEEKACDNTKCTRISEHTWKDPDPQQKLRGGNQNEGALSSADDQKHIKQRAGRSGIASHALAEVSELWGETIQRLAEISLSMSTSCDSLRNPTVSRSSAKGDTEARNVVGCQGNIEATYQWDRQNSVTRMEAEVAEGEVLAAATTSAVWLNDCSCKTKCGCQSSFCDRCGCSILRDQQLQKLAQVHLQDTVDMRSDSSESKSHAPTSDGYEILDSSALKPDEHQVNRGCVPLASDRGKGDAPSCDFSTSRSASQPSVSSTSLGIQTDLLRDEWEDAIFRLHVSHEAMANARGSTTSAIPCRSSCEGPSQLEMSIYRPAQLADSVACGETSVYGTSLHGKGQPPLVKENFPIVPTATISVRGEKIRSDSAFTLDMPTVAMEEGHRPMVNISDVPPFMLEHRSPEQEQEALATSRCNNHEVLAPDKNANVSSVEPSLSGGATQSPKLLDTDHMNLFGNVNSLSDSVLENYGPKLTKKRSSLQRSNSKRTVLDNRDSAEDEGLHVRNNTESIVQAAMDNSTSSIGTSTTPGSKDGSCIPSPTGESTVDVYPVTCIRDSNGVGDRVDHKSDAISIVDVDNTVDSKPSNFSKQHTLSTSCDATETTTPNTGICEIVSFSVGGRAAVGSVSNSKAFGIVESDRETKETSSPTPTVEKTTTSTSCVAVKPPTSPGNQQHNDQDRESIVPAMQKRSLVLAPKSTLTTSTATEPVSKLDVSIGTESHSRSHSFIEIDNAVLDRSARDSSFRQSVQKSLENLKDALEQLREVSNVSPSHTSKSHSSSFHSRSRESSLHASDLNLSEMDHPIDP